MQLRENLIALAIISILLYSHVVVAHKVIGYTDDMYSHAKNMIKIGQEINKRGHQFVMFVSSEISKELMVDDIDIVTYPATISSKQKKGCVAATIKNRWNFTKECIELANIGCDGIVNDKKALDQLRNNADLLVMDITSYCAIIVDKVLNISRVVAYSPGGFLDPTLSQSFKIPAPPSFVPTIMVDYSNKMTFFQRLYNSITHIALVILKHRINMQQLEKSRQLINASLQHSDDAINANMIIISTDFAVDYPRPLSPATKVVGPLLPHPPSQLPAEFAEFLQLSWNGSKDYIIVAFGSLISKEMEEIIDFQAIGRALSRLPFKVFWQYNGQIDNLGKNVRIYSWLPQNDLLGQDNCKVFVTHGGLNSMYEGAYHGVPMVVVPFFADQPSNAQRIKAAGIGTAVLYSELSELLLYNAILETYQNRTMSEKSHKVASIVKYRSGNRTPVEEAVDWIEYAIRHDGGQHLKILAYRWYEEYMIDVAIVIIAILLVVYQIIKIMLKVCYACTCKLYSFMRR